ncbi:MAG: hypothetical protein LBI48_09425 [Burkholderiaceae bacterium]|jgi:hypothetical protein|nr:hypothetical protein [Burkholderiaceae bacterium]
MICPAFCIPSFAIKAGGLLLLALTIVLTARILIYITWNKSFGFKWYGGVFSLMMIEGLVSMVAIVIFLMGAAWILGFNIGHLLDTLHHMLQCLFHNLRTCPS